jgi:carbamoyltransferase
VSLNVVGISAHFHDAACCLLCDGELVAAAQEERFSRRKHDPGLPIRAFRYCLEQAGLTMPDVHCLAYYEDPRKKLERQVWMTGADLLRQPSMLLRLDAARPTRELRDLLGYDGPIEIVDHHHAHAASAFHFSGFPDAAILTVDGVGEWATTTYGRGKDGAIDIFDEVHFPHSLGLLYSAITNYLGFDVNDGEYKVMGLAPYGKPTCVEAMRALVRCEARGQYALDLKYFELLRDDRMYSEDLVALLGHPARTPESEILPFHTDVARSLQVVLEEVLLQKVAYLHSEVPSECLCMAGGVALNCVANARVLRDGPFKRLFVQPAASDAGGALGAAAIATTRMLGTGLPNRRLEHAYWGPRFSSGEIHALLKGMAIDVEDWRGREEALLDETAGRLARGEVIGWFQGRMEFGPRALGARSILADPRDPGMRDRINALVKMREAFRPFAPAVLESAASTHFDLDHAAPFMLETCAVISPLSLPAITHVDGSARVQTVSPDVNPRFAALLARFGALTGCPMLLNTSFNMRGEPIVCSPIDALVSFTRCHLDALVMEDFLIPRAAIPATWTDVLPVTAAASRAAVSHRVYTLI